MDVGQIAARPSWNPLRCDGTPLPAAWLLSAKLLAFGLFPGRDLLAGGPPFLPFLPWLDAPFFAPWLGPAVLVVFYAAIVALMLNRLVRAACIAIAVSVFVHIAAHRLDYANSLLFPCVFLLLIGLYSPRLGIWPLRFQLGLVYFGASLNKALDPDWWHGRVFDTLMIDALDMRWYTATAAHLPDHALGTAFSVLTIGAEVSIAAAAVAGRSSGTGVILMIVFHATMLTLTGGQLSVLFLCSAVAIAPAFLESSLSDGRTSWMTPPFWWSAVLVVRLLPRLLPYAHSSQ